MSLGKAVSTLMPSMSRLIPIANPSSELVAIEYLKAGSIIAIPTDTVYGLACDATNARAVNDIYTIKDREDAKPLAICLGETRHVKAWANVEHLPPNLLAALLPGPVTLILDSAGDNLGKSVSPVGKVAIRVPDHAFARRLACCLGKPMALTSANLSKEPSAVEVTGFASVWDKIPAIFDGGKLGVHHGASTVVDISEAGSYRILREGAAFMETTRILKKFKLTLAQVGVRR